MATHASALKRARQSEKKRVRNVSVKSTLKTHAKKVLQAVESKNPDEARKALASAIPAFQKAAGKKVIHRNAAKRIEEYLAAAGGSGGNPRGPVPYPPGSISAFDRPSA